MFSYGGCSVTERACMVPDSTEIYRYLCGSIGGGLKKTWGKHVMKETILTITSLY